MKVTLVGKQIVSYTKKQTGELKEGMSVFYMAPKDRVEGFCTDNLWINKENALYHMMSQVDLDEPLEANLTYEMQPGSRYSTLADIEILS